MPNNPKPVILTQEGEQIFPLTDASLVTGLEAALSGKQDTIDSTHKLPYSLISGTPTIPTVVSMAAADIATAVDTAWNAVMS